MQKDMKKDTRQTDCTRKKGFGSESEQLLREHFRHYTYFTDTAGPDKETLARKGFSLYSFSSEDEAISEEEEEDIGEEEFEDELIAPCHRRGSEDWHSALSSLPRTTQVVFDFQSGKAVPRLKEPRNLYGVTGWGPRNMPRWPQECEVIPDKIHHIEWAPSSPEPIYSPCNLKKVPLQETEPREATLVYMADGANKEPFFICSRVGGSRGPLKPAAVPFLDPGDSTLVFEARFESGNLHTALKVGEYDYELTLRTDLYTDRHTQWYYFRVINTRANMRYRFTITNLLKMSSLYAEGQRPLLYSQKEAESQGVGWHRVGEEVRYYRNGRQQSGHSCYSLTWTCTFPHDKDTCYFAHCYPYTYSNLREYLSRISQDPVCSSFCKIRTLCLSLAGNLVPILTVTSPSLGNQKGGRKPAVVLTARIHPGETNSSWVMKGILDFLLGSSADAALLRDSFIFKLVPMLNPDGVIVGNYRCSLTGRDLNRNYKSILRESFPTVWATRSFIQRLCEEHELLLYCDLHGHSRKANVFMYGCESDDQSELCKRVFPLMLSKNCPDMFSFQSCKFKVQRSKEGTGRVALWRMGVTNSFTLETSFCGSDLGQRKGTHFSTHDLQSVGFHFCDTLLDYCDPDRTKYTYCLNELEIMTKQDVSLTDKAVARETGSDAFLSDHEASSSGSDGSDSNGLPAHLHALASRVRQFFRPSKTHLKSKKERNKSCLYRLGTQKIYNDAEETKEQRLNFAHRRDTSKKRPERECSSRKVHRLQTTIPSTAGLNINSKTQVFW
ncbi:cytosolic carboxypeptidase 3-like [Acipenser oxyrinchus oxyrinchus]|uniref:Cytosolic carboxypeptidase 3-like n=1 Tax=Acipenser oxyrinchus oxyrinchus TaxID=40147 RepID=A0AAD8DGC3_ACIOX|nr:cytosolic carboxypeptidase 3-like [Acipenser oxyrinchus oxyrinchus]